jgi:L-amino acid N-acyltransferase YncA
MEVLFKPMADEDRKEIIDIYNYYIENSFSAYSDTIVPYSFFDRFLERTQNYPAFSIMVNDKIAGFCFLRAYNPFPTFNECAEITYFIHKDYTGKGIGRMALDKLEEGARLKGITTILASIASENYESLVFHQKNGFVECGRFKRIIKKMNKRFDIIWMQKMIG